MKTCFCSISRTQARFCQTCVLCRFFWRRLWPIAEEDIVKCRVRRFPRMSRRLLRLVSCACLAAYALTNTHVNLAWSQYLRSRPAADQASPNTDSRPSCCKNCANRGKAGKPTTEHKQSSAPGQQSPDRPGVPNCPCCPGDHSCPMPGGCSICSIAKAPCLTEAPALALAETHAGDLAIECSDLYTGTFHFSLMRPPRG